MFKSIALKYEEDVLAMVLLTRMDSSILHKFFNDVMNAIRLWCRVSLVDGPSSNVKFYKKKLCADKATSVTPHPIHFSNPDFNGFFTDRKIIGTF